MLAVVVSGSVWLVLWLANAAGKYDTPTYLPAESAIAAGELKEVAVDEETDEVYLRAAP